MARIENLISDDYTEDDIKILIEEFRNGNQEAFEKLMRIYHPQLLGAARNFTASASDADDVLQDAMLRAFAALPKFRGESQLGTWLYRIVLNCANSFLRKKQRNYKLQSELQIETANLYSGKKFGKIDYYSLHIRRIMSKESLALVKAEIAKLPSKKQKLLQLHYEQELSYREISQKLNCSEGTVKAAIHRIKRLLHQKLKEYQ